MNSLCADAMSRTRHVLSHQEDHTRSQRLIRSSHPVQGRIAHKKSEWFVIPTPVTFFHYESVACYARCLTTDTDKPQPFEM